MTSSYRNLLMSAAVTAALLGACAVTHYPTAPVELRPPSIELLSFDAPASGVQVYECNEDAKAPSGFAWRFKGPEADLFDRSGRKVGHHYGGPTWEAPDGSKVVGEVVTQMPSPDATAIPHLLLRAKATSGNGMFTPVRSIQRLETVGGRAPADGCGKDTLAKVARVPYKATYYFYAAPKY